MASRLPVVAGLRRALHTSALRAQAASPPPLPSAAPSPPPPAPAAAPPSLPPSAQASSSSRSRSERPSTTSPPPAPAAAPPPPAPTSRARLPHLANKSKAIMPLNRPLGVPDVPTPREFGFWELMLPAAGNDEFRKAKMQAIMNEFARSNLGNIMESWRSGGKGWIAPRSIFREDKALYLPNFTGITLSSGKVKKHTSKLCNGRISLVALAGTQFAFDQVGKFINPIDNRLHQRADFQVVHVSFQSTKLKAFLSSFFANNLRSLIPENRWSTYIISTQDLKSTLEDQCLGISNNLAGYVYLVDENMKVRWAGCGDPTPEELDSLLVASTQLLDRLDKTKGRKALSDVGKEEPAPPVGKAGSAQ